VGWSWNVRVVLHSSELYALDLDMLSPMSWRVWTLGVGAVYELPKNVRRVDDVDCVHRMSADVRIPSGHGGWKARSYMMLALGW
jgi:hypothetical protein